MLGVGGLCCGVWVQLTAVSFLLAVRPPAPQPVRMSPPTAMAAVRAKARVFVVDMRGAYTHVSALGKPFFHNFLLIFPTCVYACTVWGCLLGGVGHRAPMRHRSVRAPGPPGGPRAGT